VVKERRPRQEANVVVREWTSWRTDTAVGAEYGPDTNQ
jgi:hypothetical protein